MNLFKTPEYIKNVGKNKYGYNMGLFKCFCGKEFITKEYSVSYGDTKSCGCYSKTFNVTGTHGLSKTNEYKIWKDMRKRCRNKKSSAYKNYGGRSISVCKRWDSFENFYKDMGERPSKLHSIDRIDNDKGYYPENCRWVTRKIQNTNTRRTRKITINGTTKCIVEWCSIYKISAQTVYKRLKLGFSILEAITKPKSR